MKFRNLLLPLAMSALLSFTAFAGISVEVDGEKLNADVPPVVVNGRTMVPVRAIFENLGATVSWDDTAKTITATTVTKNIQLVLNKSSATINGSVVQLDVPAQIIDGRTMVPARFVAEALDCSVSWDNATQKVIISTLNENQPSSSNSIIEAPSIIYTSTAEENGLADETMYAFGTIKNFEEITGYATLLLSTSYGDILIINPDSDKLDWSYLKQGKYASIVFSYMGFSGTKKCATGIYLDGYDLSDLNSVESDLTQYASELINAIQPGEKITLNKFNAIKEGMTYLDVVKIIKTTGELSSKSGEYEIYTWEGADKGVASISFKNDMVISKTQINL